MAYANMTSSEKPSRKQQPSISQPSEGQLLAEMDQAVKEALDEADRNSPSESAMSRLEARLARIEAKHDEQFKKELYELEQKIREIERIPLARTRLALTVGLVVAFAISGTIIELTLGRGFISSISDAYRSIAPWLIPPAALALWWIFVALKWRTHPGSGWVSRFAMGLGSALLLVVSPLGWNAALGWAAGADTDGLRLVVEEVNTASPSAKLCYQSAELRFGNNHATICLDGRVAGEHLSPGDTVTARGRLSIFGLHVERMQR